MTIGTTTPAHADEGPMPDLGGALGWLNTPPLTTTALHGKVVLFDFWTYTCINSLRNLPYVKAWAAKYAASGLVVIGVHTPEFSFEHQPPNVTAAVRALGVSYPVAIDSDYAIWNSFDNAYWPADYLVDGRGRIRYHMFGEGEYARTERVIQQLLRENGATDVPATTVGATGTGIEAPPDFNDERSDETYLGLQHGSEFASPERVERDAPANYTLPAHVPLNGWALRGRWTIGAENAALDAAPGAIAFRFRSRDLHLVLTPAQPGKPVRFVVRVDGQPPGADHGTDIAPDGAGTVLAPRLYQLVRQHGPIGERLFEVEFLDPGVHAVVFTFG
ncbi:MAG TPA: redoxin domain-containing protein [Candidatus Sulfotelmatobacter sp.]|nr:redoxin domain-containing protein [Candidatus Sulfotelmatobacter sp.]